MPLDARTNPLDVDVELRAYDWSVLVRLRDNVPERVAEQLIEALYEHGVLPPWMTRDVMAAALERVEVRLDPEEACDLGEVLTRAGTHPGECNEPGCRRLHFNTGLCRDHYDEQQRAVEARIAAQAERIQESWRSGWGSLSAAGERGRSA